jgi:hypothetical protein
VSAPAAPDYPGNVILGIDTSLGTAVGVVDPTARFAPTAPATTHSATPKSSATSCATRSPTPPGPDRTTGAPEPVTLTHVAAGMGPGPSRAAGGHRAARAFALARSLPVVAVPSHDAAALAILLDDALADPYAEARRFAVVTDARRREVAYSVYEGMDADGSRSARRDRPSPCAPTSTRCCRRRRPSASM